MHVLVLYGGDSPERAISIKSGKAVAEAAIKFGHDVMVYDPERGLTGLVEAINKADVVLPILHGLHGEDGTIQSILEEHSVKYLGADSNASKVAFNKIETHILLSRHGIKMPNYAVVNESSLENELFKKPYVLKPFSGGSSIDTLIVHELNIENLYIAKQLLTTYDEMLLEELIEGKEVTVPVLGDTALDPILIIPPENQDFDYENKYNGATQEICPIKYDVVSQEVQEKLKNIALQVHAVLQIRHLSRTDFIIDQNNELFVLELNTIPGMSEQSLFPKSAKVAGMDMPELVNEMIRLVHKE